MFMRLQLPQELPLKTISIDPAIAKITHQHDRIRTIPTMTAEPTIISAFVMPFIISHIIIIEETSAGSCNTPWRIQRTA